MQSTLLPRQTLGQARGKRGGQTDGSNNAAVEGHRLHNNNFQPGARARRSRTLLPKATVYLMKSPHTITAHLPIPYPLDYPAEPAMASPFHWSEAIASTQRQEQAQVDWQIYLFQALRSYIQGNE